MAGFPAATIGIYEWRDAEAPTVPSRASGPGARLRGAAYIRRRGRAARSQTLSALGAFRIALTHGVKLRPTRGPRPSELLSVRRGGPVLSTLFPGVLGSAERVS